MSEFKFCKDCRHFRLPSTNLILTSAMFGGGVPQPKCAHPNHIKVDYDVLVSGVGAVNEMFFCRTIRESCGPDACGIDAKLFEAKPTGETNE